MPTIQLYFFKISCNSQMKRNICNDKYNGDVVCFTFSYSAFQLALHFPPLCMVTIRRKGHEIFREQQLKKYSSVLEQVI